MKESLNLTICMAKVRNFLIYVLLIFTLFDNFLGELFWNNGDRYEGEFKDGKYHGQGKKEVIYLKMYCF